LADYVVVGLIAAEDYDGAEQIVRSWLDEPEVSNWARAGSATFLGDCSFGRGAYHEAARWYAEDLRGLPRSEVGNALMQVAAISACCAALDHDQRAAELTTAVEQVAAVHKLDLHYLGIQSGGVADYNSAALRRLNPALAEEARARGEQLDYGALVERALAVAAEVTVGITHP
jgi:hypothetical protein